MPALSSIFGDPLGLLGLLGLIPIFLLYLLRPKPRTQTIPSLMFLMRDRDKRSFLNFFRYLFRDLLLVLQVLAVIGLAVALARPFVLFPGSTTNTVVVLDDSASMHALDGGTPRFIQERQDAIDRLGPKDTIILAGAIPRVPLKDVSRESARAFIESWTPSDQPTQLSSAILAAQEYASPGERVVIVSDFADTEDPTNYEDAIATVQARGYDVQAAQVGTHTPSTDNVGIVSATLSESNATLIIKNYRTTSVTTQLCANNACAPLTIGPQQTVQRAITLGAGITKVTIDTKDAFPLDNQVEFSTPEKDQAKVLVVTNGDFTKTPLWYALRSINRTTPLHIALSVNKPPALVTIDQDVVIFDNVSSALFVGQTARDTLQRVRQGGAAIVMSQPDVFGIGYGDLLPVTFISRKGASPVVNTQLLKAYTGLDFGSTPSSFAAHPSRALQTVAQSPAGDPLIAFSPTGAGTVLWYGLPATASFSQSPDYPVFWKDALDQLLGRQDVRTLNRQTGEIASFGGQVQLPDGSTQNGQILLAEQGVYRTEQGDVAANLLDAAESDINVPVLSSGEQRSLLRAPQFDRAEYSGYAILAVLALLIVELGYMKWRGDI